MLWFKKNDWITVHTITANWISWWVNQNGFKTSEEEKRKTFYHIEYSKIRNKFRLNIQGERVSSIKDVYQKAIEKRNRLNIALLTGAIDEVLKNIEKI